MIKFNHEKINILRDKQGFEISRNGIPNPYYKSIEQIQKEEDYYNSIKDNPERLADYFAQINKAVNEQISQEKAEISAIAKTRLDEIAKNPTANFYENHLQNNLFQYSSQ
ncbi:MAG: hypothetical protein IJD48_04100 [Clostridia bacterium]|nr:hypothetical protein [Clostridia bacterium]